MQLLRHPEALVHGQNVARVAERRGPADGVRIAEHLRVLALERVQALAGAEALDVTKNRRRVQLHHRQLGGFREGAHVAADVPGVREYDHLQLATVLQGVHATAELPAAREVQPNQRSELPEAPQVALQIRVSEAHRAEVAAPAAAMTTLSTADRIEATHNQRPAELYHAQRLGP